MSHDRVIAREFTPSTKEASPVPAGLQLPPDLLSQSCKRVGVAALVFAGLWLTGILIQLIGRNFFLEAMPVYMQEHWPVPGAYFASAGVLLSLVMLVLASRLSHRPVLLLDIGLVFMVLTSAIIAGWNQWIPVEGRTGPTISWICIIVLVYPTIAPNTPGKILAAGLAAASMDPLGVLFASMRGIPVSATGFELFTAFWPNYLCALLAMLPAQIIGRLSRQVRKARELGSYRLLNVIGKGGMGEVYRAEHRLLARPAAIKLIRPDLLGTSREAQVTLSRFRREAEVVATLRSPHTIELYDFGVTDEGSFYFVMELLEGMDLESLVKRFGPLPAERAVYLTIQACQSLAEAHQRGMIHRDIKPSNIYTCRMGLEVDFVKVLDFGLVKAERLPGRDVTHLTSPNLTTGTPAFMAPEMIEEGGSVDPRIDIYAMGCVIYWMLTGSLVFDAVNAVAMMMKHVNDTPEPPSSRSEQHVPPELDAIVMACLAKKPDDRPRDVVELARQLAACPLPEPWTQQRAARWWAAHLAELFSDAAPSPSAAPAL
jgi:serine/threonine-protein kinase